MSEWQYYKVFVKDPQDSRSGSIFGMLAANEGHAIKQAKDGYTGLLGPIEETQDRLETTVVFPPESATMDSSR